MELEILNQNQEYVFSGYVILNDLSSKIIEIMTYVGDKTTINQRIISLINRNNIDLQKYKNGDLIIVKANTSQNDIKNLVLLDVDKLDLDL